MKIKQTKKEGFATTAKKLDSKIEKDSTKKAQFGSSSKKTELVVSHISDWLETAALAGGRIDAPIAQLKVPEKLIFQNSSRTDFARLLPAVFAEETYGEKIFFNGASTAEDILSNKLDHNSVKFGSFLDNKTPPLFLGSIVDMKNAGLDDFFISMLLRPKYFTERSRIIEAQVFYSLLAKLSPSYRQLKSYEDGLKVNYDENERKKALNELLIDASALEKPFLAQLLLREGADPNARSWIHGVSAINVAYNNKRSDNVHLLVEYGADPNTKETYPMSDTESFQSDRTKKFIRSVKLKTHQQEKA